MQHDHRRGAGALRRGTPRQSRVATAARSSRERPAWPSAQIAVRPRLRLRVRQRAFAPAPASKKMRSSPWRRMAQPWSPRKRALRLTLPSAAQPLRFRIPVGAEIGKHRRDTPRRLSPPCGDRGAASSSRAAPPDRRAPPSSAAARRPSGDASAPGTRCCAGLPLRRGRRRRPRSTVPSRRWRSSRWSGMTGCIGASSTSRTAFP